MDFETLLIIFMIIVTVFSLCIIVAVFIDLYLEKKRLKQAQQAPVVPEFEYTNIEMSERSETVEVVDNKTAVVVEEPAPVAIPQLAPKKKYAKLPKITVLNEGKHQLIIKTKFVGQPEDTSKKFVTSNKKVVINLKENNGKLENEEV